MANEIKVGTFIKDAGAAPHVQSIVGVGFMPKALILFTSMFPTALDTWTQNDGFAVGISSGPGECYTNSSCSQHNVGATDNARASRGATEILATTRWGTVLEAIAELVSFDVDGFTINWTTDVSGLQHYISYIAIGGVNTQAKVHPWLSGAAMGVHNVAVAGVGFEPECVFHLTQGTTAVDNLLAGFRFGMGVQGAGTLTSGNAGHFENDNDGAEFQVRGSFIEGEELRDYGCLSVPSTALDLNVLRMYPLSLDPDGFSVRFTEARLANIVIASLCLRGFDMTAHSFKKSVAAAPVSQDIVGLGFNPTAVLLFGSSMSRDVDSATTGKLEMGAATATDEASAHGGGVLWAVDPTKAWSYHTTSKALVMEYQNANPPVVQAECDVTFIPDGFRVTWTTNNAVDWAVGWMAFGEADGPPEAEGMSSYYRCWKPGEPELAITDGTTTVSLLNAPVGVHLREWGPARAGTKAGGWWRDTALADGRRLVDYRYENIVDSFSLLVNGWEQDDVIRYVQDLDRLLIRAMDYWTRPEQRAPIYLMARGPDETNTRYAIIHAYQIGGETNPYAQPFYSIFDWSGEGPLTLSIEHGLWQELPPGDTNAVTLTAQQEITGVVEGRKYVVSARRDLELTHVWYYDASVPGFSANLVAAAPPYNLLPAAVGDGDMVYFMIDQGAAEEGPFCGLVFDLSAVLIYDALSYGMWEYYDGLSASWLEFDPAGTGTLEAQDGTAFLQSLIRNPPIAPFSTLGENSVHWIEAAGLAEFMDRVLINGVTGYCVRVVFHFNGGNIAGTATQQNRVVYIPTATFVDVTEDQIEGDIDALAAMWAVNWSHGNWIGFRDVPDFATQRIVMGLRSYDRGPNFTAYLNCSQEQNPANVTATLGTNTAWRTANMQTAPAGEAAEWTEAGAAVWDERVIFTLFSGLTTDNGYGGEYRAFVRGYFNMGNTSRYRLRIRAGSGGVSYSKEAALARPALTTPPALLDIGRITIPAIGSMSPDDVSEQVTIAIESMCSVGGFVYFFDLILIPADEWIGDFVDQERSNESELFWGTDASLEMDSAAYPQVYLRGMRRNQYNQVSGIWQASGNGPMVLHPRRKQRMWILPMRGYHSASGMWTAYTETCHSITAFANGRYVGMRGVR